MKSIVSTFLTFVITLSPVFGQFEVSWHTIDGGGASGSSASIGGTFEMSGTIGQPDASSFSLPMSGGAFEVVGGFWVVATPTCSCPGDMIADGTKHGRDIQIFVNCLLTPGDCACADVDQANGVNLEDLTAFVSDLLAGTTCP